MVMKPSLAGERPLHLALTLVCLSLSLWASPGAGQDMDHAHHSMHGGTGAVWPMPPMKMPMMEGMNELVPSVQPFLPAPGSDLSAFQIAEVSRLVELSDGDTLTLRVSLVRREINGREYLMYGYNGQYPGPLIRAPVGSTPVIHVINEIELPTTVHWHGVRLDNRFDGVPGLTQDPIAPGESFYYHVHVRDAGMFWYHPHVREDVQQGLGLYGNLLVVPDVEGNEYAPVNQEELLALDDILMSSDGQLIPFGLEYPTHALMGRFGNVFLTNGRTDHRIDVERDAVVRFYLTNVASARTFNIQFGGHPVKLVASDIGRYEREQWVGSVIIAPAERYVIEARFGHSGTVAITNTVQAVDKWTGTFYLEVDTLALVEVGGSPVKEDFGSRFELLAESPDVIFDMDTFRGEFDRVPDLELVTTLRTQGLPLPILRMMEIDTLFVPPVEWNDPMPMMNWVSTGREVTWILRERDTGRENEEISWVFQKGDVVKIRVFNDPRSFHPMNHPIHIHGQRFLVVARDGVPQENLVWKDTALLPVGSTMDLLVEMSNPGRWMVHCHIPEHLHTGMMFNFTVLDD